MFWLNAFWGKGGDDGSITALALPRHQRREAMRVLKVALAVVFLSTSMVALTSVVGSGSAEAKDKPGKCGTMKYYDKKTKKCVSKG
jgi:hypothetical protein